MEAYNLEQILIIQENSRRKAREIGSAHLLLENKDMSKLGTFSCPLKPSFSDKCWRLKMLDTIDGTCD